MFVHLGNEVIVPIKDIVAIINMDTAEKASETKEFLQVAAEEGFIVNIGTEQPKTFIVTSNKTSNKIYLSPISSGTLKKRGNCLHESLL